MSRFPALFPAGGSAGPIIPVGWDRLVLGGLTLPGRAHLTGGALRIKVDPKKKSGAIAQKPTTHGLDAQEFAARIVVWTQEQLDEADDVLALLLPPRNLSPVTLDHPQAYTLARMVGKIDVLVTGGGIWLPSSIVRGGREMSLSLLHWPAAAKGATTAKSDTAKRPDNKVTAADAARNAAAGVGTVRAPTDNPSFAAPTWP